MDDYRNIGHLPRLVARRKTQLQWLRLLVDCGGQRNVAIAASPIPKGTILRWLGTDEWLRARYAEIRAVLVDDAEALRDELMSTAVAMAMGQHRPAVLRGADVRRVVDQLDAPKKRRRIRASHLR